MRVLIPLLAASVAAACSGGSGGGAQAKAPPPPRDVDVLAIAPAEVRDTGEYLATLSSRKNITVLPQVSGYVRRILVKPGQLVEAGQPLVEIDSRTESAVLESTDAQRRSAEASLVLARQTLSRTEALYAEGLVSAQELERARSDVAAKDAAVKAAAAQVSQRRVQLQYFAVRAPFAGRTGDVTVRLGDWVGPQTPVTTIAQSDVLEASLSIPAERARGVNSGTPVELLASDGSVVVASTVFFVAPQANPRTQLVEVKAAFHNTVGMRPNEIVRARIVFGTSKALQVPALAVVRQSGQAFVMVAQTKDGQASVMRKPVKLGRLGETSYVVESGLTEGELVAVSSLQYLRDGSPIQMNRVAPAARDGAAASSGRADPARSGR